MEQSPLQEVLTFLKACGHYFVATAEGDQPRVRPFGPVNLFENKLYLLTGKHKKVAQQVAHNPKVEICAYDGKESWLRIQAELVNDDRRAAKVSMMEAYPKMKKAHPVDDPDTQVLYLKNAVATFSSFNGQSKVVQC
jgi:uncharacterized pyridoxamine 5'-phosphate oxidase family protein